MPNTCTANNATEARLKAFEKKIEQMQRQYELQIASLTAQINELSARIISKPEFSEDAELMALRQSAIEASADSANSATSTVNSDSDRKFIAGELSRQAENPELSVVGDFLYRLQSIKGNRNYADAALRNLGVHYETYLDPNTRFKGAVPVKENISLLGEAYITRYGVSKNLNLTIGKFRQQFGIVHRWHQAALDQTEFPLAMRRILGDGGLVQNGVSFEWHLGGSNRTTNELTMQLTEATNERLFAGNTKGVPSMLLHLKSFKDISKNTYNEIGLTALAGVNDLWTIKKGIADTTIDSTRPVLGFGLDFTHLWEPADNMKYRNFMWRTEFYGVKKDILTPDLGNKDSIFAWGGYTNLQWKLDRQLESGFRIDYYEPDTQNYAAVPGFSLSPLAVTGHNAHEWQICPYMTWQQSPWVKYRLEFDYKSGHNMGPDEKRLMLQCIWAAGPHKHDRY
ncbi:MAG: hypothetical protein PHF29_02315 [Candidatus Riflebacteria bacterium]|nr:hypothetical protein [Candidatus Riflebacteria bacterium]